MDNDTKSLENLERVENPGYTISCENPTFQTKIHDVFAGIDSSTSNMASSDSAIESDEEQTEGICRAHSKAVKKNRKPDFLVNPSRYTKYSLRDTELTDNKSNSHIAFQFLQSLSKSKDDPPTDTSNSNATHKQHVFKMPEQVLNSTNDHKKKSISTDEQTVVSCDKVELEHLDENISAAEYVLEIAAKLDDSIARSKTEKEDADVINKHQFKSVTKKTRRHLRNKSHDEGE